MNISYKMPEHTPAPTPARSLYGFFMFLFSKTILAIYCIWALIPDYYLHYLNIYYYPQKYWSTAVPIQLLIGLTMFAMLVYPSSNLMLTINNNNINTIKDSVGEANKMQTENKLSCPNDFCICHDGNKCMKHCYVATAKELAENTVPQLQDLDMRYVSRKLYLNCYKRHE